MDEVAEFALWQHQTDALAGLREARGKGHTRIVLQAPPGAGKTEIATELTKAARGKDRHVTFTVPMLTLVDQTVKRFEKRGIPADDIGVMQAKHERTKLNAPVQVVSVQTLARRENARPLTHLAIIDECHLQHESVLKWMAANPDITFIGLSATPWAKGMAEHWHTKITVATIAELIEKGILAKFRTFVPAERPDLSHVSEVAGDYAEDELSDEMSQHRLVADVVKTWLEKAEGRPTLVFAVDRKHAATITNQFTGIGVRAQYVDGETEMDDRAAYIDQLRTGEVQVIVSIGTMTTGVDIPWVSCISYVRPTRSHMLFVQSICRGLRSYDGKEDCLILDHSMTTATMGLVTDIEFPELRKGKHPKGVSRETERETPRPRECMQCHFMIPPKIRQCPECGWVSQLQSEITYEDGELVEFGAGPAKPKRIGKTDEAFFFGELKAFGQRMGYKPGWPAVQFKERFGVWPRAYEKAPLQRVSTETLVWIRERQLAYKEQQKAKERYAHAV
jgi:DNA repair protein RadD